MGLPPKKRQSAFRIARRPQIPVFPVLPDSETRWHVQERSEGGVALSQSMDAEFRFRTNLLRMMNSTGLENRHRYHVSSTQPCATLGFSLYSYDRVLMCREGRHQFISQETYHFNCYTWDPTTVQVNLQPSQSKFRLSRGYAYVIVLLIHWYYEVHISISLLSLDIQFSLEL